MYRSDTSLRQRKQYVEASVSATTGERDLNRMGR
jgi:hypothetical protein